MSHAQAEEAYCELRFSPNVSLIATVRRFVGEFYTRVLGDAEITSRLVVATHELLENAVRYSIDGNSGIRIGVKREPDGVHVVVDTNNRTDEPHRRELAALLEEMNASESRETFYQTLMRRSAKRTTGSGLGLGRIHAESEMNLTVRIEDDNMVRLRAEGRFPLKGAHA
jgi:anti-sigma regulatory factor (Ser/Thr protein kinase)